jgi:hypothetical protein
MMIRRKGNRVIVGTFQNYRTRYVWTFFVRSEISITGVWKEGYAGASQVTTPVSSRGIEFDRLDVGCIQGIDPADEKYALYVGRVGLVHVRELGLGLSRQVCCGVGDGWKGDECEGVLV